MCLISAWYIPYGLEPSGDMKSISKIWFTSIKFKKPESSLTKKPAPAEETSRTLNWYMGFPTNLISTRWVPSPIDLGCIRFSSAVFSDNSLRIYSAIQYSRLKANCLKKVRNLSRLDLKKDFFPPIHGAMQEVVVNDGQLTAVRWIRQLLIRLSHIGQFVKQ